MKKQMLSLIFMIIASIGLSQTMPTLTKTSNSTPITINDNDTLLVPIGDSVWINNVDAWNTANIGDVGNFFLLRIDPFTLMGTNIDTLVVGNNDKYRFKVTISTKYKYAIRREFQNTPDIFFYVRGTTGVMTGISNHDLKKSTLRAYPNPVSSDLTITFDATTHNQKVSVFDIQGRLMMENTDEREIGTNTLKIDVMPLNAGIYFVRAGSETYKVTKQ